jgi:hypothetical protein
MTNYAHNDFLMTGALQFFPEPPADHMADKPPIIIGTAGAAITLMNCIEYQSDSKWDPADATGGGAQGWLGVALHNKGSAIADTDTFYVVLGPCFIRDDTFAFTVGADVYVSATAGALTTTAPAVSGDTLRVVGYAYSDDCVYFNPIQDESYNTVP